MSPDPLSRRLGVLISGRGSNLQAINDAIQERRLDAEIAVVISNEAGAAGLQRGRENGLATRCISHRDFSTRHDFDRALVAELRAHDVGLVCLAGFMRLVGAPMLEAFPDAILNIHPSLLPAFPGVDAQRQALQHGVKVTGVTVHLVTPELDGGPIVLQRAVPIKDDDTVETLSARILVEEHRAYPDAIALVLNEGWQIVGRRFVPAPAART
jgi:phosphoribosylglycinamide formyltransferase 1